MNHNEIMKIFVEDFRENNPDKVDELIHDYLEENLENRAPWAISKYEQIKDEYEYSEQINREIEDKKRREEWKRQP